jgi:membrane fusion protein, heavy metal efflux system
MRNIPHVVVGMVLGIAVGGGSAWWWLRDAHRPADTAHAGAPAEAGGDAHGHGAPAGGHTADEHGHAEGAIILSEKAIRDSGIQVVDAAAGELEQSLTLPGEIVLNADRVAHIVPRVTGIVRRVDKNLGDLVQAGEVMAILESRELAEAKAAYLAAQQRLTLAEANLNSAAELRAKKIMPDLEYLAIEKAKAEAEIESRTTGHKLHALGVSAEQLRDLPAHSAELALYELRAPFAGTVVEKHCALGEVLDGDTDAFVLADLSTVWANITVYTQDMARVHVGQTVQIRADALGTTAVGTVSYVAPVADEATRTVCARADLPNAAREWRPGTFVTASILLEKERVPILVPTAAVQRVKGETVVFVSDADGFEPRPVTLGRTNHTHAEVVAGLAPGEKYVAQGAVMLKAELGKSQTVHQH